MNNRKQKIPVGILGATGAVGQRFCLLLANHPWFQIKILAASPKSAGKKYLDIMSDKWLFNKISIPQQFQQIKVNSVADDIDDICQQVSLVFSAIDADAQYIRDIEMKYAKKIAVLSNNSAHRWTDYVPMIIPEINSQHFKMINNQQKAFGWNGFIVTKPNCSVQSYVSLLKAWKEFKPIKLMISTYQAISGAGKNFTTFPDIIDNIIPYISGEEEKSEKEPLKILASLKGNKLIYAQLPKISSNCFRVPVLDGHMAAVNISFANKPSKKELISKLTNFYNPLSELNLPSAPAKFINYFSQNDRPQTKLDRNLGNGMTISIGRIREDTVFDFKLVALSHNTIRGAAGGNLLNAEALVSMGYIK